MTRLQPGLTASPSWPATANEPFLHAARLPDTLVPASIAAPDDSAILVTGATGFLGGHLLRALLCRTSRPIVCLVRGDEAAERSRLLTRLDALGASAANDRIRVVSGDVTQPNLGLSAATFRHIADGTGVVFHLAARLDFRSSFDTLRATNVDALQQILSLASAGVAKRTVYVSSLSVLDVPAYYRATVTETTPLTDPEWLPLGYAQTKWVAERLLSSARERGYDVICVRPSWIVGEARRGIDTDFIAILMRVFAAVGATPDTEGALNLVPADFVAEACARLGLNEVETAGAIGHLGASRATTSADFASAIAATGRPMDRLPLSDFMSRLSVHLRQARSLELMMFRHIFLGSSTRPAIGLPYLDGRAPVFDSTASLRALTAAGLPPPKLDLHALVRVSLGPAAS